MSRKNVEIVRELYRLWNSGDPGFEHYASDLGWDVSRWAPDLPTAARGRDDVRKLFRRFLGMWAEIRYEPEQFIEHEEGVLVILTVHGRGRGSGVPVARRCAHAFTLRDGLVARFVLYPDPDEALEAVGLRE